MTATSSLEDLLHDLAERRGLDLRGYKPSSLQRRLRKRMEQLHIGSYGEYQQYLQANPTEVNDLLSTVLINVTEFFRDPQAWQALKEDVLPMLLAKVPPGGTFRAWCAGCASGEEVYSLAMLVAEHFGPKLNEYEVKIYATDNDPEALDTARRAEYAPERLRRVPTELKGKYFTGNRLMRVSRELRRLAIFGRSDLVSDAPISHVQLLMCRNVLIYFDTALQREVLDRFRFALEPGGVLFLGKSESQLQGSTVWRALNPKWRIFQRMNGHSGVQRYWEDPLNLDKTRKEYESLRMYQRELLETLRPGVLILDADDVITTENESALAMFGLGGGERLAGQRLHNTPVVKRCPELPNALARSHANNEITRFQTTLTNSNEDKQILSITIRPMTSDGGHRTGTLIYVDDITLQEKLRSTIEELQSTNEELETTNEELQSLNEELETANTELEARTQELDVLNEHFAQTLSAMPMPVIVVNQDLTIELWNDEAEKVFGLPSRSMMGLTLQQMPIEAKLRKALVKRVRTVTATGEGRLMRRQVVNTERFSGVVDIHLTPLEGPTKGVLLLFETSPTSRQQSRTIALAKAAAKKGLRPKAAKKSAKKTTKGAARTRPAAARKGKNKRKPKR